MRKPTLTYISSMHKNLQALQDQGQAYFTILPVTPLTTIDELMREILSSGAEAMVTDHQLEIKATDITFNGADVVERMRLEREGFPVFILAEDRQEAEHKAYDVNIVYDKKYVGENMADFLQRVERQVLKYKQQLEEKEDRLIDLMSQQKPLTQQQENEVMALNFALEKSIDKQSARSMGALTPSNQDKLKGLLDKVDVMIQEVNK